MHTNTPAEKESCSDEKAPTPEEKPKSARTATADTMSIKEDKEELAPLKEADPSSIDEWLQTISLHAYAPQIKNYGCDSLQLLDDASEEDMREMTEDADVGMKKLHRSIFMKAWSRRAATRGGALAAAAVTKPLASDTRAVTHSHTANTQPNEEPNTVPASAGAAGAPHASEVAEAMASNKLCLKTHEPHVSEVAEAMALDKTEEKRFKRNEQAKKMRERRGGEIKEKQRIYAKTYREKLKKERENAMANEEGLKQAASNGAVTAVAHSEAANTQPNEVPDTVPASARAPHASEVAEAMALNKLCLKTHEPHASEVAEAMALNKAEEKRLKKKEQNKNHREKLKKELKDAMEVLKQAASNAAACHTSKGLVAPGAAKGARDGPVTQQALRALLSAEKKRELEALESESAKQVRDYYEAMGGYWLSKKCKQSHSQVSSTDLSDRYLVGIPVAPPALGEEEEEASAEEEEEEEEEMSILHRIETVERLGVDPLRTHLEHLLATGHKVVRVCLRLCLCRVSVCVPLPLPLPLPLSLSLYLSLSLSLSLSLFVPCVRACLHVIGPDGVLAGASSPMCHSAHTLAPTITSLGMSYS
jgi:hypothetical protein